MIKVILITILGCVLLGAGGIALLKPELLPFMNAKPDTEVPVNVPLVEVTLNDVLIPINIGQRQKLLLADISLFTNKLDQKQVEETRSKITHTILSEFSIKPEEYYTNKHFISVFQSDLERILVKESNVNFKIKEVLVTKVVYQ